MSPPAKAVSCHTPLYAALQEACVNNLKSSRKKYCLNIQFRLVI